MRNRRGPRLRKPSHDGHKPMSAPVELAHRSRAALPISGRSFSGRSIGASARSLQILVERVSRSVLFLIFCLLFHLLSLVQLIVLGERALQCLKAISSLLLL